MGVSIKKGKKLFARSRVLLVRIKRKDKNKNEKVKCVYVY